ncbi:phosphate signaling complex protein PhoU [Hazenella sp. IB182357]|uniref:Phosphate-specific transport system accessory protein PhoU n=1 Tax=Polycladospora coralii TaxID=2771432 RepID=A0A926RUC4_9BACL|nr:phosphate signaling complex protein PhoU [Polycladospora coralii]MBS7529509.1 phosphate signaling complex protein PhoU [Polycladospora coralii]
MERQFDHLLKEVKNLLLDMGSKLEVAIDKAMRSLTTQNVPLAELVISEDSRIDQLENQIDDVVAKLIATQQPVAKDLRMLIAVMKISADMERMADLASNIAKVTTELAGKNQDFIQKLTALPEMAKTTQMMVHDSINSYIAGNTELAKKVARTDDLVDRQYVTIVQELTEFLPQSNENAESALKLCFVARYLERIADHATNIVECVFYIETGKKADLN